MIFWKFLWIWSDFDMYSSKKAKKEGQFAAVSWFCWSSEFPDAKVFDLSWRLRWPQVIGQQCFRVTLCCQLDHESWPSLHSVPKNQIDQGRGSKTCECGRCAMEVSCQIAEAESSHRHSISHDRWSFHQTTPTNIDLNDIQWFDGPHLSFCSMNDGNLPASWNMWNSANHIWYFGCEGML